MTESIKRNSFSNYDKSLLIVTCTNLCKREGLITVLREKFSEVNVVSFPTYKSNNKHTILTQYLNNSQVSSKELLKISKVRFLESYFFVNLIFLINFVISAFLLRRKHDIYIGEGLINSYFGLILKKLRLCNKVIYCSGDYFPQFKLFIYSDYFLSKNVDVIWSASSEMISERKKNITNISPNMPYRIMDRLVPLGIIFSKYERDIEATSKNRFILCIGNIQERLGYDVLLKLFETDVELNKIRVIVVGDGPYLKEFKSKVKNAGLTNNFIFFGFIEEDAKVDFLASICFVGLALYDPRSLDHTKFSDPGKIKDYIARDLPVILTSNTTISETIMKFEAGLVIGYNPIELHDAITHLKDLENNIFYTKNVKKLKYDLSWEKLLTTVLQFDLID
jgi:glycosyltransferase involved in cell wall biosynthesis